MNAGLSNLTALKAALLPEAMRSTTRFDAPLLAMSTGIAAMMQKQCNRIFSRLEDAQFITGADCVALVVDRPPMESMGMLEIKRDGQSDWEDVTESISNVLTESGTIILSRILGDYRALLRATYTGGWWWQTWDTGDDGSAPDMPENATPVPADLVHAWHLQCQTVIERSDLLGAMAARATDDKTKTQVSLPDLDLIPQVKSILSDHLRYS